MSARETHVTEWGLYMLATRPTRLNGLDGDLMAEMEAAGFRACRAACDGDPLVEAHNVGYHMMRDQLPTCPLCAVLRDEALEGRLPKREAKT